MVRNLGIVCLDIEKNFVAVWGTGLIDELNENMIQKKIIKSIIPSFHQVTFTRTSRIQEARDFQQQLVSSKVALSRLYCSHFISP